MARAIKLLVAVGLLVCFVGVSAEKTVKYKIKSVNLLYLEPSGNKTEITISADAYLRPSTWGGNTVSITLSNLGVSLLRENNDGSTYSSLTKCPAKDNLAVHQTFSAAFNDKGELKSIKVVENEDEFSINFKLFVASILQRYHGQTPARGYRNELTTAGSCPMKNVMWKVENYYNETADMTKCSEVVSDSRGDGFACLDHTCKSSSQRKLEWISAVDARLLKTYEYTVMDKLILTMQASYSPFEYSNVTTNADIFTEVNLSSVEDAYSSQNPNFEGYYETIEVSGPRYKRMNTGLCEFNNKKKKSEFDDDDSDLRQLYSALACQQSFSVIYLDIIERIIDCTNYH